MNELFDKYYHLSEIYKLMDSDINVWGVAILFVLSMSLLVRKIVTTVHPMIFPNSRLDIELDLFKVNKKFYITLFVFLLGFNSIYYFIETYDKPALKREACAKGAGHSNINAFIKAYSSISDQSKEEMQRLSTGEIFDKYCKRIDKI